ncbi:MAG: hypothetical protein WBC91_03900 [Phototrophicaceae bacterium]
MIAKIMGIGDAGCAFVTRLNYMKTPNDSYHTIALNTVWHPYDLVHADEHHRLQAMHGLGTKGNPMIGRQLAEQHKDLLFDILADTERLIITAGMGGGTGTGASHVVAYVARELRIPTLAIVTTPFTFEGAQRRRLADLGIKALGKFADEVLAIHGDQVTANLLDVAPFPNMGAPLADYYAAMQHQVAAQVRFHLRTDS